MRDERKFIQAVENRDVSTVESMLLMDPGLVETVAEAGISIILYATYFKDENICKLLVEYGPEIMARSDDGRTALDFANQSGNSRLIKLLSDNID